MKLTRGTHMVACLELMFYSIVQICSTIMSLALRL